MTRTGQRKEGLEGSLFISVSGQQSSNGFDNMGKRLLSGMVQGCTGTGVLMQAVSSMGIVETRKDLQNREVESKKAATTLVPLETSANARTSSFQGAKGPTSGNNADKMYDIPDRCRIGCAVTPDVWQRAEKKAMLNNDGFWGELAVERLRWMSPFTSVSRTDFTTGDVSWLTNGKINACDNCVDRWAETQPDKVAVIFEHESSTSPVKITYKKLREEVCRFANLLKCYGVKKGDVVGIYMPTMLEGVYAMLACARIGAIHACFYTGLSAKALASKLMDINCKLLITADKMVRCGHSLDLKKITDDTMKLAPCVQTCFVLTTDRQGFPQNTASPNWIEGRNVDATKEMAVQRPYCPLESLDAEDPLFVLYSSGTAGVPKGIVHATAGFLLQASFAQEWAFDMRKGDVFCCPTNIAWISSHLYSVYGSLSIGGTSLIYDGSLLYPDNKRFLKLLSDNEVAQTCMPPSLLSKIVKEDPSLFDAYELSKLRVIVVGGQPISPEVWKWCFEVLGKSRCAVTCIHAMTETGPLIGPLPGTVKTKAGSCGFPYPGIDACLMDQVTGTEIPADAIGVTGVLCIKRGWPGMIRTIWGNHEKFIEEYLKPFPGCFSTGDFAYRDADGHYWVTSRQDDRIDIKGYYDGASKFEFATLKCPLIVEAAAAGIDNPLGGHFVAMFVVVNPENMPTADTWENFRETVSSYVVNEMGEVAAPKYIVPVPGMPKTRSGKISRHVFSDMGNFVQKYLDRLKETAEGQSRLQTARATAKRDFLASDVVSVLFSDADREAAWKSCGNLDDIVNIERIKEVLNATTIEMLLSLKI